MVELVKEQTAPMVRYWNAIKQAKSAEGGMLPSIRGPLVRLMRDSYMRYGELQGVDARGESVVKSSIAKELKETNTI